MPQDDGKGSFTAEIPEELLREAVRAVDRHEAAAPGEPGPAGPDEAARLRAELELSQQHGREAFEKLKEEHERFLRAAADLENFRKRAAREREEAQKYGAERLLKELFPVVDNLDRALAAAPPDDPLAGGVRMVLKALDEALARNGVRSFRAMGQPFDPRLHEAIATVPGEGPSTVIAEHGRGFQLHERLVRPALVVVSVPPSGGGAGEPGTGAG